MQIAKSIDEVNREYKLCDRARHYWRHGLYSSFLPYIHQSAVVFKCLSDSPFPTLTRHATIEIMAIIVTGISPSLWDASKMQMKFLGAQEIWQVSTRGSRMSWMRTSGWRKNAGFWQPPRNCRVNVTLLNESGRIVAIHKLLCLQFLKLWSSKPGRRRLCMNRKEYKAGRMGEKTHYPGWYHV